MAAFITFLAFIVDWIIGDPQKWPHPVRYIGRLIGLLEARCRLISGYKPVALRLAGTFLCLLVVLSTMAVVSIILALTSKIWSVLWFFAALYLVYAALCLKDLYQHTWRVEQALKNGFLDEARHRLSWVVGRDTGQMDESAIRRALIETLAENLSDGLIAPLFYLALGGPVLAWGYKAINTLDSMVGYKNEQYMHLGRFSAKLDDVANYIPARLTALLIIFSARLQSYNWRGANATWRRDKHLHCSPNSGHPEAAMAGALGIWLGGPGHYGGVLSAKPKINAGGNDVKPEDMIIAEKIMIGAALLMLALVILTLMILTGTWGWL